LIKEIIPDPEDENSFLLGGCMALGEAQVLAPASGRATSSPSGYSLRLFGTEVGEGYAHLFLMTGDVLIEGPSVTDDSALGAIAFGKGGNSIGPLCIMIAGIQNAPA